MPKKQSAPKKHSFGQAPRENKEEAKENDNENGIETIVAHERIKKKLGDMSKWKTKQGDRNDRIITALDRCGPETKRANSPREHR